MKRKINTKIISMLLALIMIFSIIPMGTITASAAGQSKTLSMNWDQIQAIGPQQPSMCSAYALAYCRTILDKTKANPYNYWNSQIGAMWSWGRYSIAYPKSNAEVLKLLYDQISNGRPAIVHLYSAYSSYGHWVAVVGYKDVTNVNSLSTSNFLIIDPYKSSFAKGIRSLGNYTLNSDKRVIITNSGNAGFSVNNGVTTPPAAALATTPNISTASSDIAIGKSFSFNWSAQNAAKYEYKLTAPNGTVKNATITNTSFSDTFTQVGTYSFQVRAYNSDNKATGWSSTVSLTTHNACTVRFEDYDGSEISSQTVEWGKNATAPVSPSREGYTFQSWSDSYYNVTSNKIIKAVYKINTYTVNFLDRNNNVLKTEKVEYNLSATPPDNKNVEEGYEFLDWASEDYKNVYTQDPSKTINVQGIYNWANQDLPVICTITSATRQTDGYYVFFDIKNYDKAITRGRAVITLKTASGKLVDTTESAAFSIPVDTTKTGMEVFIPCDKAATNIEVIIVNSYSSGVPISEMKSSAIDQGLMWSEWSTTQPVGTDLEVETRTVYRSSDKETTTGNTKTKDGWTWDGTRSEKYTYTGFQDSTMTLYENESIRLNLVDTRQVPVYATRTLYCYYHFYKYKGGNHTWCPLSTHAGGTWHQINVADGTMRFTGYSSCASSYAEYSGPACPICGCDQYWFKSSNSADNTTEQYVSYYKNQYNYRTTDFTYNFYRWKDWTDWNTNEVTASDSRKVETQEQYRYKSASAGIEDDSGRNITISGQTNSVNKTFYSYKVIGIFPVLLSNEIEYDKEYLGDLYGYTVLTSEPLEQKGTDNDGNPIYYTPYTAEMDAGNPIPSPYERTCVVTSNGTVDADTYPLAGKQISIFVYKVDGASDYTNEYVGQSTIAEDGSYSFTFKLREEPTVKTGDFTVAIGIEGTSNTIVVDTIAAPKPTHNVKFYDWDGNIISEQTVVDGENATVPTAPEKEGYDFVGWDESNINISSDVEITAQYKKKQFSVVFVDWQNQLIEVKSYEYGDALTTPDFANIEGYTFTGWDKIVAGKSTVTENMVVAAEYDINTYTVKFCDYEGNIISTQEVEYGSSATAPTVSTGSNGEQFAGWFNPEEYTNVNHDVVIVPSYYFEETTDIPTANYTTGEYNDTIQLELTSPDENAVIYYYLDGDISAESIYTGPITVDKSCSVSYYATSLGKNNSDTDIKYYCINNSTVPSEWMLYSELPSKVTDNLDRYVLESDTGYKYKNTKTSASVSEIEDLMADGWTHNGETYTNWTAWQDEEILADSTLNGFEIGTQEVEDTSVIRYQYSHYKYTDGNGTVQYSATAVDGFDCTYETVTVNSRLSIAGFLDDGTSYYVTNGQTWFKQTKVNGTKTQYHSRYKNVDLFKWTAWTTDAPTINEAREYSTDDVYRYYNKNYHIVNLYDNIGENGITLFVEDGKAFDMNQLIQTEGYEFTGIYNDEMYADAYDTTSAITESKNLYVKYTPKKYTVVFQMMDGTELDTQTVSYLDSATAPQTDSVPGFVFGGWDKEFDCITGDTVITGRYYKESEYARVTLSKDAINLFNGTQYTLYANITPVNLSGEDVIWSSSDTSVATVDDKGVVMGISKGTATITAKVVKTKETATCVVTVNQDLTTGILLKSDSPYNYDEEGYLRRVTLGTTAQEITEQFANTGLKVFDASGVELLANDKVGTGTQVRLYNGGLADFKTVVITGDMSGDGLINNRDVATLNRYLVNKVTAKECQMLAIDVNGDGYVNNRDAAMVARYLVGKDTF